MNLEESLHLLIAVLLTLFLIYWLNRPGKVIQRLPPMLRTEGWIATLFVIGAIVAIICYVFAFVGQAQRVNAKEAIELAGPGVYIERVASLWIDPITGCHYISRNNPSGWTPRLNPNGKPYCPGTSDY